MALRPLDSSPTGPVRWSSRASITLSPSPAFLSGKLDEGEVRIGDERISFTLPGADAIGFTFHPSAVAVHALTTFPDSDRPALYILIDDAPEEDGDEGTEMWVALPAGSGERTLQHASEAVSEVVRLHASVPPLQEEEDVEEGTFDDAAGDSDPEVDEQGLSAQGQRTLAHLENVLDWPTDIPEPTSGSPTQGSGCVLATTALSASASTLGAGLLFPASFHHQPTALPPLAGASFPEGDGDLTADLSEGALDDADEEPQVMSWTQAKEGSAPQVKPKSAPIPSPVLIFTGLPKDFFDFPRLGKALLDLLHAYGELRRYVPLPAHGRAIVVYAHVDAAARAKDKLDRLLIPLEGDGSTPRPGGQDHQDARVARLTPGSAGLALRVYFGQRGDELIWAPLPSKTTDESNHLLVPAAERNFLISPPGSPPVGWEPIVEDAPNRDTLADDLIAALGRLRDLGGIAFADNDHGLEKSEKEDRKPRGSPTSTPPPEESAASPVSPEAPPLGHGLPGGAPQLLIPPTGDMPGVQVSFALEEENAVVPAAGAPTHSISSVKATVDAFYASHGHLPADRDGDKKSVDHRHPAPTPPMLSLSDGQQRIFPTARPPVELRERD